MVMKREIIFHKKYVPSNYSITYLRTKKIIAKKWFELKIKRKSFTKDNSETLKLHGCIISYP